MSIAITLILAYLIGSIPFGLVLSKVMGAGDIRKIGSGNIGATNALRTGNKKLAALTLLLDMFKGTLAVLVARAILPTETLPLAVTPPVEVPSPHIITAGLIAVLGHVFPVWLKFKGGKGVATALGVLLGLSPIVFVLAIATWLGMFKWKRISSLSALVAFALCPLFAFGAGDMNLSLALIFMAMFIFFTHRENIRRMLEGEEGTFKKPEPDAEDSPEDV